MSNLTQQEIEDLFYKSYRGDATVLQDPNVSKARDKYGNTTLHYAAEKLVEALQHPDVDKVKNAWGKTPKDLYEDKNGAS